MKNKLVFLFALVYLISIAWLSSIWYTNYTSFHFFDDLFEWEYLDKFGHFFASFQLGVFFYKFFGDTKNLNPSLRKKWICFTGFILLLPIEILDGFSLNYGASPADLLANGLGSLFSYGYVTYQFISTLHPKFSFHFTAFSLIRPEMLGSSFLQQTVKDYNGQTYWLTVDLNKMLGSKILPNWLMLSIGYGAEGLLGGHDNIWETKKGVQDFSSLARTKRLFISVDINVTSWRLKNKFLRYLLAPFLLIKFPAPTIEINFERGIIFHPIYF